MSGVAALPFPATRTARRLEARRLSRPQLPWIGASLVARWRALTARVSASAVVSRTARYLPGLRVFAVAGYLYTLLWLVLAILVFALVGLSPVAIQSGSMSPLIKRGDVVMLGDVPELPDGFALTPGTVIAFHTPARPNDGLLTHRISMVSSDGTYITKGDANAGPDSDAIPPEDVVGVGRVVVPLAGLPAVWVAAGSWLPLVAWALVTVLAARLLLASFKEIPRRRGRRAADVRRSGKPRRGSGEREHGRRSIGTSRRGRRSARPKGWWLSPAYLLTVVALPLSLASAAWTSVTGTAVNSLATAE